MRTLPTFPLLLLTAPAAAHSHLPFSKIFRHFSHSDSNLSEKLQEQGTELMEAIYGRILEDLGGIENALNPGGHGSGSPWDFEIDTQVQSLKSIGGLETPLSSQERQKIEAEQHLGHLGFSSAESLMKKLGCLSCESFSAVARAILDRKLTKKVFTEIGYLGCDVVLKFGLGWHPRACRGVIDQQFDDSIYPIVVDKLLERQTLCTFVLYLCDTDVWEPLDIEEFISDILAAKPPLASSNDFVNNLYLEKEVASTGDSNKRPIKVALISDIHIDYDYTEGMDSDCGMPLCCRSDSGVPSDPQNAAGKWGDYSCDVPEKTVKNMLEEVRDTIQPDVVIWLGDSIPHNVESLNLDSNVHIMKNVTATVADLLQDYRVFPAIGNHDTYPQDILKFDEPRENEAINQWAPTWRPFLFEEQAVNTFVDFGYYSLPLVDLDGKPIGSSGKSKIISLNTNFCYNLNWEVSAQFQDPGNMLDWLQKELLDLEAEGGSAVIIAHVPNLNECSSQFGRRYHAILDRFQTVVRTTFYSHIHEEQLQVVRDVLQKRAIGTSFIVGSTTTYQGKPPSFNVIHLDPDTLVPVDYETYAFDLEKANREDVPQWNRVYNYRELLGLKDLSPNSLYDYATQIYANETVALDFMKRRYVGGPGHGEDFTTCDHKCRLENYCLVTSNDFEQWQFCNNRNKREGISGNLLTDTIGHTWYRKREAFEEQP